MFMNWKQGWHLFWLVKCVKRGKLANLLITVYMLFVQYLKSVVCGLRGVADVNKKGRQSEILAQNDKRRWWRNFG